MKHCAWDDGAIASAFVEVLGFSPIQKTTKTRCGKRVSMRHIDNNNYDCPDCCENMQAEIAGRARIKQYCLEQGISL